MARKATAAQKARAKKLGVRVTKTVRGKRVELDSATLKKRVDKALDAAKRKKAAAKRKAKSKRQIGSSVRSKDKLYSAKEAGTRRSKSTSKIKMKVKDPKTGKLVTKTVSRTNANQHVKAGKAGGRKYTERRANRTDRGKFL